MHTATNLPVSMAHCMFVGTPVPETATVIIPEELMDILPNVAVIVVVPAATHVPIPLLFTLATDVLDELQVTCADMSRVDPSEYEPVAVN